MTRLEKEAESLRALKRRTGQSTVTLYALVIEGAGTVLELWQPAPKALRHSLLARFDGKRLAALLTAPQRAYFRDWFKREYKARFTDTLRDREGNQMTFEIRWSRGLRVPIDSIQHAPLERILGSLLKQTGTMLASPPQVVVVAMTPEPEQLPLGDCR